MDTAVCRSETGGALLRIKVRAGAKRSETGEIHDGALRVSVTAAPERGKANAAVLKLLARALGLPASACCIMRGASDPHKVVRIEGLDAADVRARLGLPES